MKTSLRYLAAVVCGAAVLAPTAQATTESVDTSGAARTTMGRVSSSGASLLVTFDGAPAATVVASRLADLGAIRQSVPEIGIWELVPNDPVTARAAVLRRAGVARAEWSFRRTLNVLPVRKPAIPALPQVAVGAPTDNYYVNAVSGQWSMHTGKWTPSLTGYAARPIIAILDSGLDTNNPEWNTPGLVVSPWSTVRNVASAPDWSTSGHGTHVAGIAAAPINGAGVVGVAPANTDAGMPGARVMPVQIADEAGFSSDARIINGIVHAVNHGAKVINISSGGPGYNQAFQDVVNWAYRRRVLIVASVGNEGQFDNPVNFPAGYDHVIGVAAQCDAVVDKPDCPTAFGRATFSNYNYSVDTVAPGVNILSTVPMGVVDMLEAPGFGRMEGTSMASPYVAGTAALIYSSHPGLSPFQAARLIESTSSRGAAGVSRTPIVGWGVVNPQLAVTTTAPLDDLTEPNDDTVLVPSTQDILLSKYNRRKEFTARADYFDDQFDVYSMRLDAGKRVRVTLWSTAGRLGATVYRGLGRVSPRVTSDASLALRQEGISPTTTPGTVAFVFKARVRGRHFLQITAVEKGGPYRVKLELLN